ncbi:hypothetical protein BH23VER1_BH23VER1_32620 [soil metagenome]
MIKIPIAALQRARTLLSRASFAKCNLPAPSHVLARTDGPDLVLAVSAPDLWLETRIRLPAPPTGPAGFLIPAGALAAAARADRGSTVLLQPTGRRGHRELEIVTVSGGMRTGAMHATADREDFPARPAAGGPATVLPAATMAALQAVAPCASTDGTRQVLNGVLFTPGGGGMLITTDGRRLAGAPAAVPGRELILPNQAARVLGHPDFLGGDVALTLSADEEERLVEFQAGDHVLICRTVEGRYPDYRQVVPREQPHAVTIPEDQRAAICKWLRSQNGRAGSVRLSIGKPGHLTLTQADGGGTTVALITVPVQIQGTPPAISFDPKYLADAIGIGGILGLSDGQDPGMARTPDGRFCVVMPMRTTAGARTAA